MKKVSVNLLEGSHPIQVAARYTGLNSDLIRAWEKRYDVVQPTRSSSGRRLYSNQDIQRLSLLRQVTQFGRRIGEVAYLPTEKLAELVKRDEAALAQRSNDRQARLNTGSVMELFDQCLTAVVRLDTAHLQTTLENAARELSIMFLLEDLISPLLHHIEEECRQGEMHNCHQRLATEVLRGFLTALATHNEATQNNFIVCSMQADPMLTALRTAVIVNTYGWHPVYLGENAPGSEIADAGRVAAARAAIVSFDDADADALIPNEMRRLASLLPDPVHLIIHAPDSSAYASVLSEEHATHTHSFGELRLEFERLSADD